MMRPGSFGGAKSKAYKPSTFSLQAKPPGEKVVLTYQLPFPVADRALRALQDSAGSRAAPGGHELPHGEQLGLLSTSWRQMEHGASRFKCCCPEPAVT